MRFQWKQDSQVLNHFTMLSDVSKRKIWSSRRTPWCRLIHLRCKIPAAKKRLHRYWEIWLRWTWVGTSLARSLTLHAWWCSPIHLYSEGAWDNIMIRKIRPYRKAPESAYFSRDPGRTSSVYRRQAWTGDWFHCYRTSSHFRRVFIFWPKWEKPVQM